MKKHIFRFVFSIFLIVSFAQVKAACNDEELNYWATQTKVEFSESTSIHAESTGYAYFLSVSPLREDITIKVTDQGGNSDYAKKHSYVYYERNKNGNEELVKKEIYGVGCFTNLEEETYTVEIYGGDDSSCKNELLKTLTYTVPRYNRMIKNKLCEDYPNHELCKPFTNKTKSMSQSEFEKKIKEDNPTPKPERSLIVKILLYSLYVIIPFAIITVVYMIKVKNYKGRRK